MAGLETPRLRVLRNSVIGSRTKKSELVSQGKVPSLVALLIDAEVDYERQGLAATIVGSLANGAPPPTLLSLCRARTTEALLSSLSRVSRTLTADQDDDLPASSTSALKLVEALLRALRSLLIGLADEVSPGTKWERGLGLASKIDGSKSQGKSKPLSAVGMSSREIVGWQLADAGFDLHGNNRTDAGISLAYADVKDVGLVDSRKSPQEELVLLARDAIAFTFREDNLPFWIGALFISRLPRVKSLHSGRASGATSLTTSQASTRPASPAIPSSLAPGSSLSRSSSRMSMASSLQAEERSSSSRAASPIASNQVRLLTITEMVLGILSSCLATSGPEKDDSPLVGLSKRRKMVLNFVASESPFLTSAGDERGRRMESESAEDPMQASFVKRGKSSDAQAGGPSTPEARLDPATDDTSIFNHKTVLDVVLEATECGYRKTQEAALWALAELSRENNETTRQLFSCFTPSGLIPTSMLVNLRKSSSAPIRLAAFCCLAHIIKVHPFSSRTNECVLSVLTELIDFAGDVQIAAIFALGRLLADDTELQILACEQYDCIDKLAKLLEKSKQPALRANLKDSTLIDDHSARRREATLSTLAALCFQRDDIRRKVVDHTSPSLLPLITASLSASHVGVRMAGCRLVRALSRSTSILRTSLVDAGAATKLLAILQDDQEEEQVKVEVTASLCNLLLNFSPMKQVLMDEGGVNKIVQMARGSYGPIKLNALWAVKNILYSSEATVKKQVMEALGWDYVRDLAGNPTFGDADVQEQALNIIRNVCCSNETDVDMAFRGFGGGATLLNLVEEVIWQRRNDNVLEQAAFILVNIATGNEEHRRLIIHRPNLLDALVYFLNHPRAEIREAGVWAATNLTQPTPRGTGVSLEALDRLKSFHFDKRLKELVDDPERDVSDRAKGLLSRFVD